MIYHLATLCLLCFCLTANYHNVSAGTKITVENLELNFDNQTQDNTLECSESLPKPVKGSKYICLGDITGNGDLDFHVQKFKKITCLGLMNFYQAIGKLSFREGKNVKITVRDTARIFSENENFNFELPDVSKFVAVKSFMMRGFHHVDCSIGKNSKIVSPETNITSDGPVVFKMAAGSKSVSLGKGFSAGSFNRGVDIFMETGSKIISNNIIVEAKENVAWTMARGSNLTAVNGSVLIRSVSGKLDLHLANVCVEGTLSLISHGESVTAKIGYLRAREVTTKNVYLDSPDWGMSADVNCSTTTVIVNNGDNN